MEELLKTDRLLLRRFQANDGADLYDYLSDPETVKYEPYGVYTLDEAKKEAARRSSDPAFWAVCLKETKKMVGNIYFARQEPETFKTWELGYVFNSSFSGRGYATEAAKRILKYGFEACGAHRIEASCNPQNTRSWRLLERLSLRREGYLVQNIYFQLDGTGQPNWQDTYVYAMLASEWSE